MIAPILLASSLLVVNGAMATHSASDPSAPVIDGSDSSAVASSDGSSIAGSDGSAVAEAGGSTAPEAVSASTDTTTVAGEGGGMVSVQVVKVSNKDADLIYDPEELQAEPGSMVQFQFYPKSHTLTQSTFDRPCEPINQVMSNVTGINSGPMPPENGMMKVFTMMVNDTQPLWMYCATGDHCQQGMSMVINPPPSGEKTLEAYKTASAQASTSNSTNSTSLDAAGAPDEGLPDDSDAQADDASSVFKSMVGTTGFVAVVAAAFVLLL